MRTPWLLGVVGGVSMLCMNCGSGAASSVRGTVTGVASNQVDTLAEVFQVYIQWVNPTNVKTEFDMVVDNNPPVHFELQADRSLAILIGQNEVVERDPIFVDADNVTVVRVNTACPEQILFENIFFGDEFFAGDIVMAQSVLAYEAPFEPDGVPTRFGDGVLEPAEFFCFSAWQIIVAESDMIITALDRAAAGVDEAEVEADEVLSGAVDPPRPNASEPEEGAGAARGLPEDLAPRTLEGAPFIPSVAK